MENNGGVIEVPATEGNRRLFELATFLATSARGCVDEPPLYGPLRLIDGISRLAELPKYASCLSRDSFLEEVKKKIDENRGLVMYDQERFVRFLDGLVIDFAQEVKRRAGAP